MAKADRDPENRGAKGKPKKQLDDFQLLKNITARISEHYPDYLILVRTAPCRMSWMVSDDLWAKSAAERFLEQLDRGLGDDD